MKEISIGLYLIAFFGFVILLFVINEKASVAQCRGRGGVPVGGVCIDPKVLR